MSFLEDIAGDLVGGVLGFAGQSSANSANAAAAQADRDFQREVLQNRTSGKLMITKRQVLIVFLRSLLLLAVLVLMLLSLPKMLSTLLLVAYLLLFRLDLEVKNLMNR